MSNYLRLFIWKLKGIKNLFNLLKFYKMTFLVRSSIHKWGDQLKTRKRGIQDFMIWKFKGIVVYINWQGGGGGGGS